MKKIVILILFLSVCITLHSKNKIKVACVGNSVTYGYLLPERETNCYPAQLQRMLSDNYDVRNFGKSGATLLSKGHRPYIEQDEYKAALDFTPDYVVIHLGLNDTDPRNWHNYRDDFFIDYLNLINSFRKKNPKCKIWICRMTPITHKHPRFRSGTRNWYAQIQQTIEQVAEYANVNMIDFQEPLYHRPDLLPDALHPDTEGAQIVAKTVYSAVTGNYGGLQMSAIYSNSMVLQRNKPLIIKGIANAGEKVTVKIAGQNVTTTTANNGKWEVQLQAMKEGGPYSFEISTSDKTLQYNDVLIGEVWLCSGQSNMAFPLKNDADVKETLDNIIDNSIRLFNMLPEWETVAKEWNKSALDSLNKLQYYKETKWTVCNKETASQFSAVAYYFGKMLHDSLNVPIGLIQNAVGGSPTESWIDRRTLEFEFPDILNDWTKNDFIQDWVRSRAALNIKLSDKKEQRHPYAPCYLFETGIYPLNGYAINGVIWYQGESNAHNIEAHEKLFELLVNSWRKYWNNKDLPFYYVQLSSINRPSWAWFRNSQRQLMQKIPHTYMAVSSDKGDSLDVHPIFKKDIGQRLGLWALNKTYNKVHIIPSGPLYKSVESIKDTLIVTFEYANGLQASNGNKLLTFEIAETDGLYFLAEAIIENDIIKLWSDKVKLPRFVRYGWQAYTLANLINKQGLPASHFTTEIKH